MGKGPCLWSGGLAKPEFFIEDYNVVGDEYDNNEDEDCVDIDPVEARPELSVIVF